jgi:DNA-binding NtrC family response regulator
LSFAEAAPGETLYGPRAFDEGTAPERTVLLNGLQLLAMHPLSIPAIVVTGFPDPVLEAQARQFGATFLLKPFEPAGLVTIVEELLRDRELLP